jgi:hypothetical protein
MITKEQAIYNVTKAYLDYKVGMDVYFGMIDLATLTFDKHDAIIIRRMRELMLWERLTWMRAFSMG